MNIKELISDLLTELSFRTKEGYPILGNREHLSILSHILDEWGLHNIKTELIQNLLEAEKDPYKNPILNKVIKYKNIDGEEAEGRVGDLLRRPKEEDAYKQAMKQLGDAGSDTYRKAMADLGKQNRPGFTGKKKTTTTDKEKTDTAGGETPEEEPVQTGTALSPTTTGGKNYIDSLPDEDPAKKEIEPKKTDTKVYSENDIAKYSEKLDEIDTYLSGADIDENTKQRSNILKTHWLNYLHAKTKKDKIDALRIMAENNLIEAHAGGKKIYLSPNTSLPYKLLTGPSGNSVTKEMNELIKEAGIELPVRGSSKDRALADISGKHNEAGVVAYLDPSEENQSSYNKLRETFKELGGAEEAFDKLNKRAAQQIKDALPNGAKITKAQQVGGIGKSGLSAMDIDNKTDPTDVIVYYTDVAGNEKSMKISSKTYSDPKNITMKNSGASNAGSTYLGSVGKAIDDKFKLWKKEYAWKDTMDDAEKADQKRKLRQVYLQEFSKAMQELADNEEGQKQLVKMWKDVHGCGKGVYTQVINKNTGDVQLKPPDYYCDAQPPFGVDYDGVKLVINMGGQSDRFLQIDLKTEDKATKLMFRHRSR